MTSAWWNCPAEQVFAEVRSRMAGLSAAEAQARLRQDGPNLVGAAERHSPLKLLMRQFTNPLALILLFGASISMTLREWLDASIILAIVGGSGLLGFSQEYRASKAVEALRKRLALRVSVWRDGTLREIPVAEVVAGDVVQLSAGNLVPADGLVVEAADCQVTEAALTGESLPVEKQPGVVPVSAGLSERTNCLFMGSSVRSGSATLLVVETGRRTQYGAIADRLNEPDAASDFTRGIRHFGTMLVRVMIAIVLAVLTINQLLGRPIVDSLLFSVALAVGLSPEMLPAIISVTLAAGARHLASDGVIVRRLDAIENLGSMDILCTDKTGTLTEGVVRLDSAVDIDGNRDAAVLAAAFLNASLETGIANALDQAIVSAGNEQGLTQQGVRKLGELPYDFNRRRLSIAVEERSGTASRRLITKGAFAEMMAVCTMVRRNGNELRLGEAERDRIEKLFVSYGEAGYRVLAVADRHLAGADVLQRTDETGMTLLGLLLFLDPPKQDVQATLEQMAGLGIEVKVISGDNRHVTAHVAAQVGMTHAPLLTGQDISGMSDEALRHVARRTKLFAEIDPQQKERIIRALQAGGDAIGYMGDGINDAPALRLADVGISVDSAVDVARESADVVLLRHDLAVLRKGVADGRKTFANTLKYISITTSANFGNMVSMALATPLLPFLPLLPKQILLNNFLSDIPSLTISGDNIDAELVAAPQDWDIGQIQRFMIVFGLISSCFDLITFAALRWLFHTDAAMFQTIWFMISLLTELVVVLVLRTRRLSWQSRPSNLLLGSTGLMTLLAVALPLTPGFDRLFGFEDPSWILIAFSLLLVVVYAMVTEAAKIRFYRRR